MTPNVTIHLCAIPVHPQVAASNSFAKLSQITPRVKRGDVGAKAQAPKLAPKAKANPQSRENAKPQPNKAPPSESKAGKPPQSGSANSSKEKADIPSSATTNVAKSAPKASSGSNVKKPPKLGPKKIALHLQQRRPEQQEHRPPKSPKNGDHR